MHAYSGFVMEVQCTQLLDFLGSCTFLSLSLFEPCCRCCHAGSNSHVQRHYPVLIEPRSIPLISITVFGFWYRLFRLCATRWVAKQLRVYQLYQVMQKAFSLLAQEEVSLIFLEVSLDAVVSAIQA